MDTKLNSAKDVVNLFFVDYRLHECRQNLWNLVEAALTSENHNFSEPTERAELIEFYRMLELLLEAAHLINIKILEKEKETK